MAESAPDGAPKHFVQGFLPEPYRLSDLFIRVCQDREISVPTTNWDEETAIVPGSSTLLTLMATAMVELAPDGLVAVTVTA